MKINFLFIFAFFSSVLPGDALTAEYTLDTIDDLNENWEVDCTYASSLDGLSECIENPNLPPNSETGFWSVCGSRPVHCNITFHFPADFKIDTVYYRGYSDNNYAYISLQQHVKSGEKYNLYSQDNYGQWGEHSIVARWYYQSEDAGNEISFSLWAGRDGDVIIDKITVFGQIGEDETTTSTEPNSSQGPTDASTTSTDVSSSFPDEPSTTESSESACVQRNSLCQPRGSSSSSSSSEEDRGLECCGELQCRKGRGNREKNKKQYQCRERR